MTRAKRLILSQPVDADFQRYFEIYSDPETNLFNPMGPMDLSTARIVYRDLGTHWETHAFGLWAIREEGGKDIIGFGGLSYRFYGKDVRLNLGYRFDVNNWGKGFATELSEFAIAYAFDVLGFQEVYALVRPEHAASIRVLQKAGMRMIGTLGDVKGKEESLVFIALKSL
ncbi:MAG: GNAT family N-acetyltransferase [Flavitalea sp.]